MLSAELQVLQLETIGRRIEARFGRPQDIEWCLDGDGFAIVQARPITTLFPIPVAKDDDNHVYVSVGHQQMMTDAMKPLGLSVWQLIVAMDARGGRPAVRRRHVAARVAGKARSPAGVGGTSDPLIGAARARSCPRRLRPDGRGPDRRPPRAGGGAARAAPDRPRDRGGADRAERGIARAVGARDRVAVRQRAARLRRGRHPGPEADRLRPAHHAGDHRGQGGTRWLNEHLKSWLGERDAADVLTQSVPDNVTSEMGLALLDVADTLRDHAVGAARDGRPRPAIDGGALDAFGWLDRYGMRCVGEIDITRPRWNERPAALAPVLLSNIRNFAPGEGRRRFEQGLQDAQAKERDVLARLATPSRPPRPRP